MRSKAEEKRLLIQHMTACRALIKQESQEFLKPVAKVQQLHQRYKRFYPYIAIAGGVLAGFTVKKQTSKPSGVPLWQTAIQALLVLLPLYVKQPTPTQAEASEPTKSTNNP